MVETEGTSSPPGSEKRSATVTVVLTTAEAVTPVMRRGVPQELLAELSVRQLIHRLIGPEGSVIAEGEWHATLGIGELLATGCCEVWTWREGERCLIPLDAPVASVLDGGEVRLDVRLARDNVPPGGTERRRSVDLQPPQAAPADESWGREEGRAEAEAIPSEEEQTRCEEMGEAAPVIVGDATALGGYVRKADLLRARFQPEVEVLDFRGLFVGNKGMGILGEQRKREPIQVDPAQIADLLLRGNGYRRNGNHVRALMCYQELMELDPANKDFRFLLERTYQAIAGGAGRG